MKNKRVMVVASIIIVIIISIAFTSKAFQNDTFYTIKIGQSILKNGIDMKDHFSIHTLPYTYPHWLYDIGIYKVYKSFGFHGLYICSILIFMLIGVSFYLINLKRNKSYFMSLLFSIMALIMMARYAVARAQLVTYLLFLFEIFMIEELVITGKKRYIIGLFIICLLVANLHAAVWPLYFILMLPYLAEYIVYVIRSKIKYRANKEIFADKLVIGKSKYIKSLFIVFFISLFIGLLTPIGDIPYTYFIKIMMGTTTEYIDEHKPLVLVSNAFIIYYILTLLITLIFTRVKIRLRDLFMIGGLLLMTFLATRHFALLAILGMFYLCRLVSNIGKIYSRKVMDFDIPLYGMLIVLVAIVVCSGFAYSINSKEDYINKNLYPVEMVDWMRGNLDMKKVVLYNDYDFGSYLIYRNIPVFIDSRSDLYTKPFNGKVDIFEECMKITEHYGRVFKKYNITHILIYKDTYLNQVLSASSNYEVIKGDDSFNLFKYLKDEEEK